MIDVIIRGIPNKLANASGLVDLVMNQIPKAVAGALEIELTEGILWTSVPPDLLDAGLGEELRVQIHLPADWTVAVKNRVAEAIKDVLQAFAGEHLPECKDIKVRTVSFDPLHEGAATWTRSA